MTVSLTPRCFGAIAVPCLLAAIVACQDAPESLTAAERDPSAVTPAEQVDLSGTWALNEDLSDRPGAPEPPFDGSPRDGARPDGPPGAPPHGGPDGSGPGFDEVTITQGDDTITFTRDDRSFTYFTDGRTTEIRLGDRGTIRVTGQWEDEALVLERTTDRGTMIETWRLVDAGARLSATVRIEEGPRGEPVELTRIYERA
ncbi:MAG: hypothetical protein R3199_06615 [Gemmatimonadota bacterium]|nr:hypothetical protein [Gemmatimonadota bacterium]